MWTTVAVVIWILMPGDLPPFWERAASLIIVAWLGPTMSNSLGWRVSVRLCWNIWNLSL